MSDRPAESEQRVTALELFFDLVFVFAITQVTGFLADNSTWLGLLQGLLLLMALWWAWASYAWLTNWLNPEEGAVRLAMFGSMAAMLIVSLAVPHAFGVDGVIFGVAYFIVRVLDLVLYAIAGRGDRELFQAILRITPGAVIGPALLVVAGFTEGTMQIAIWIVALTIDYLWVLIGGGRGWRVSPEHFVERHGLIVIIALGESIVAIGVGAAGVELDAGTITAALLGVVVAAALWWSYFDWVVYISQARLAETTGAERAVLARDLYTYLHLPMIAGIILFALGMKTTLAHVDDPLDIIAAIGLCGGLARVHGRPRRHAAADRRRMGPRSTHRDRRARSADPGRHDGAGARRARAGRGRLRGPHRVRGAPLSVRALVDPEPSGCVHDGGSVEDRRPGQTRAARARLSGERRLGPFRDEGRPSGLREDLAQLRCERLGLAGRLAVLAAHESAVAAREDHHARCQGARRRRRHSGWG